jgi:hypothetical protein
MGTRKPASGQWPIVGRWTTGNLRLVMRANETSMRKVIKASIQRTCKASTVSMGISSIA